jgi:hypothetical protein
MNARTLRWVVFGILAFLFVATIVLLSYPQYRAGAPFAMLLINMLLLSVPMGALFFSLGLIFEASLQHRAGKIGSRMAKLLYFTPRIAGLLIALFTGMFALDVFEMAGSTWEKIGAFLLHAAPALVLLVLLAIAWRWPWVGTVVFGLAAFLFLLTVLARGPYGFGNLLLVVLPMALVAALFWLNWRWKAEFIQG